MWRNVLLSVAVIWCVRLHADDALTPWRSHVTIAPVASHADRHVIHSYFNVSPESPDGSHVVYYTSGTVDGETGDVRVLNRSTGEERILADNVVVEDAHRAACQQWSNDGQTVVYHDCRDGRWFVVAVDLDSGSERTLAADRQVGFGSPVSPWVPVYGCHWNPGEHRDLELVHAETCEIRTAVSIDNVVNAYGDWINKRFGTTEISIFFPVVSPDGSRVFFKLSHPSGGDDFRSKRASDRDGKVVFDLEQNKLVRLMEKWGHPAWTPDGRAIFEKGNFSTDIYTGKTVRHAKSCFSDHPSVAPHGQLFVTDADVTKRELGEPGDWAIGVGAMDRDEHVVVDLFSNKHGAKTWRHNHPHPVFNAAGNRIYYNTNAGPWTTLKVAEIASLTAAD